MRRPELAVLSGGAGLQYEFLHTKAGEWTQCDVVFDSLNHTDVNVYFGLWSNVKASFEWKDWSIEEIGLVNGFYAGLGRRVWSRMKKTGKELKEGDDYEPIVDPHMGNVPYAGEYQSYHTPPVIHTKLSRRWREVESVVVLPADCL